MVVGGVLDGELLGDGVDEVGVGDEDEEVGEVLGEVEDDGCGEDDEADVTGVDPV